MGRAFRVLKRTAHLTVHVSERPEKVVPVGATPGAAAPRRPRAGAKKQVKKPAAAKRATKKAEE
jgi:hypothetical protein